MFNTILEREEMMRRSVLVMKLMSHAVKLRVSEQQCGSMLITVHYKQQKGGFLLFDLLARVTVVSR